MTRFPRDTGSEKKGNIGMLANVALVLIVLYALGLFMGYTMGGWIHLLLALAVFLVLVRRRQFRRMQ